MNNELTLHHGSNESFNEFDVAYISNTLYGWGFNFTTDIEFASDFGDKIYTIEIPDDANIFDFDNTDLGDEIFEKFSDDIESHGISKDYIDMGHTNGTFREEFWMMQTNYMKLLGLSKNDAMKRLTDILKSFGFIGAKRGDIYVIFDRENFKIKDIKTVSMDESIKFSKISKRILKEEIL